jgi:ferritin-like protein
MTQDVQDARVSGDLYNRTGLAAAADAARMRETAEQFQPKGSERQFRLRRQEARGGMPPVGTMPPPASLKGVVHDALRRLGGQRTTVLLDKLGERLAFERTGTRLYETLLEKHGDGAFEGGPSRAQLERIRDEEAAHFELLHDAIVQLDGDPTAMTPSADLAAVTATGVVAAVADARTNLAESLEAILVAELVDRDGWVRLIELVEDAGLDDLAGACRSAELEEEEHLALVRSWLSAWAAPTADETDE